jgi:effector-binding domain-containing protein
MGYAVRTEHADARTMAAIRSQTSQANLGSEIVRLLDVVWPVLREQGGARPDHNVVVYHGVTGGLLTIDVGVELLGSFVPHGDVRLAATPAGEVATTTHVGAYSDMGAAYSALDQWCSANERRPAGVNWEVYGDWEDDPAKLRTDVFFLLEPVALAER